MEGFAQLSDRVFIEIEPITSRPARRGANPNDALMGAAATVVDKARKEFESAVQNAIRLNVETFFKALSSLDQKPDEFELNFALKMGGEVGNVIVSKMSAEGSFGVKITWKSLSKPGTTNG